MVQKSALVVLCTAFLLLVGISGIETGVQMDPIDSTSPSQTYLAPNIWAWGIIGSPDRLEPFFVWANVSANPEGTDIKNVTLKIDGPNATIRDAMIYNLTSNYYEKSAEPLPNDGVFRILVIAYDIENRSRTSYDRIITAEANPEPPVDTSVTLPYVVGGSLGLAAVVLLLACLYDRRQPALGESR